MPRTTDSLEIQLPATGRTLKARHGLFGDGDPIRLERSGDRIELLVGDDGTQLFKDGQEVKAIVGHVDKHTVVFLPSRQNERHMIGFALLEGEDGRTAGEHIVEADGPIEPHSDA